MDSDLRQNDECANSSNLSDLPLPSAYIPCIYSLRPFGPSS